MNEDVKNLIEGKTGIVIDGKVTLVDAVAILKLVKLLLQTPDAKGYLKSIFAYIEDHIKDSKTKVDDTFGLPLLAMLKRSLGV